LELVSGFTSNIDMSPLNILFSHRILFVMLYLFSKISQLFIYVQCPISTMNTLIDFVLC